jgi:hypothetical protein
VKRGSLTLSELFRGTCPAWRAQLGRGTVEETGEGANLVFEIERLPGEFVFESVTPLS